MRNCFVWEYLCKFPGRPRSLRAPGIYGLSLSSLSDQPAERFGHYAHEPAQASAPTRTQPSRKSAAAPAEAAPAGVSASARGRHERDARLRIKNYSFL